MQVIAAIVRRQKMIRMLRITHDVVEVNHRIEISLGANPSVHCLPVGLAQRTGMIIASTPHKA